MLTAEEPVQPQATSDANQTSLLAGPSQALSLQPLAELHVGQPISKASPAQSYKSTKPRPSARKTPTPRLQGLRTPSPSLPAREATSLPRSPHKDENADEQFLLNPANLKLCISSYPYTADKNDELSFVEGQVIRVVRTVEGGWWEGQVDQRVGWFPANHVEDYVLSIEDDVEEQVNMFANTMEELDELRLRTIMLNNEIQGAEAAPEAETNAAISDEQEGVRNRLLNSFIAGEKQYFDALQRFMDEFVYPLYQVEWFPLDDHQSIFGNIEDLAVFQKDLVAALEDTANGQQLVGQRFLNLSDRFSDVYTEYCTNLPHAVTVSTKYGQNAQMTKFLQSTSAKSTPPILHMVSLLHKPAQWKNRYQTTLKELLDATEPSSPDHLALASACQRLNGILNYIEQMKKLIENKELVRNLKRQIEGWEGPKLELYGDMILEGNLKLQEGVRKRERRFYLLEKILIIVRAERSKNGEVKYKLIEKLLVTKTVILAVSDQVEEGSNLSFQISYLTEDSRAKTLFITAFNPEQKDKWAGALRKQLEENVRATFPSIASGFEDAQTLMSEATGDGKPRRTLKFFSNWSAKMAKIRKKRPSVPNLKEIFLENSENDSGEGDGNLLTRVIRKKETREKLKQEAEAREAVTLESPRITQHHSVPLQRASILSHAELALPRRSMEDFSAGASVSFLEAEIKASSAGKRSSVASNRSNRSHRTSGSFVQNPDVALAHAILEPPPPMPPLPTIVKENMQRRSRGHSGSSGSTGGTWAVLNVLRNSGSGASLSGSSSQSFPDKLSIVTKGIQDGNDRPHTPLTATNTSQSSSPASFLWMGTSRNSVGGRSRPPTPGPETVLSRSVPSTPTGLGSGSEAQRPVRYDDNIVSPVAKAPCTVPFTALEGQADMEAELAGEADTLPRARQRFGSLLGTPVLLEQAAAEWQEFIAFSRQNDWIGGNSGLGEIPRRQSGSREMQLQAGEPQLGPPSPVRDSQLSQLTITEERLRAHPSLPSPKDLVDMPSSTSTLPRRIKPPDAESNKHYAASALEQPVHHRKSNEASFQSVVPAPKGQSRDVNNNRYPYHTYSPSTSAVDLSSLDRKSPKRKSSMANLVQTVRGSVKNLFRRSKSTDALKHSQLMGNSGSDYAHLEQDSRKSSFSDLKELFSKRRRSRSAGMEVEQPSAQEQPVAPLRLSSINLPTPVVLQQPTARSPTRSRVSGENASIRGRLYASSIQSQSVPLPSPLPSAPSVLNVAGTAPARISADIPAQGMPETIEEEKEDGTVRRVLDSGVYGLSGGQMPRVEEEVEPVPPIPDVYKKKEEFADAGVQVSLVKEVAATEQVAAAAEDNTVTTENTSTVATLVAEEEDIVENGSEQPEPISNTEEPADKANEAISVFEKLRTRLDAVNASTPATPPVSYPSWALTNVEERHPAAAKALSRKASTRQRSKSSGSLLSAHFDAPEDPASKSPESLPAGHPHRVLRRARSNLAALNSEHVRSLKQAMAFPQNRGLTRLGSVENFRAPNGSDAGSDFGTEEDEDEYGPVIGRLERARYAELVSKCEAMASEIKELKNQLKAVVEKVQVDAPVQT